MAVMCHVNDVQLTGFVNYGIEEDEQNTAAQNNSLPRFRISTLSTTNDDLNETPTAVNGKVFEELPPNYEEVLKSGDGHTHFSKNIESRPEEIIHNSYQGSPLQSSSPFDSNNTAEGENHLHAHTELAYMTQDVVPMAVFYSNAVSIEDAAQKFKRPTLDYLRKGDGQQDGIKRHWDASKALEEIAEEDVEKSSSNAPLKLGWMKGVVLPTVLNIWGVILFLRIPMIVGNAGIGLATVIILLATVVTTITALSMSAVCTNGEVKGGGVYYMISRSLGSPFGGSIGFIFSAANAIALAMHLIGLGETIVAIMEINGAKIVGGTNDVRLISFFMLIFIFIIALIGLEWVMRAQTILLILLLVSIAAVIIGTGVATPEHNDKYRADHGITGLSGKSFRVNFVPEYRDGLTFFKVFAIFFPACTGIMAGANLSGDLKDPSKAVPGGTLLAILITSSSYVIVAWFIGASTSREVQSIYASTNYSNPLFSTASTNYSNPLFSTASTIYSNPQFSTASTNYSNPQFSTASTNYSNPQFSTASTNYSNPQFSTASTNYSNPQFSTASTNYITFVCDASVPSSDDRCKFGTTRDMQIIEKVSIWSPLVLVGIFAATLSSALSSLVSAPKIFQALCRDKLFPYIGIFGKGFGKSGEPRNGYILTAIIGAAFIGIGELNAIAPIISNFFLMAYALVNYSTFQSSLSKSPGWRPSFKFYNMWISLIGFILCIVIMFFINWWATVITIAIVVGLYKFVELRRPLINWGSSGQAYTYLSALRYARRLDNVEDHVKNYRVQVLCLSGQPPLRPNLIDFASHITKHYGLLVCGDVVLSSRLAPQKRQEESRWLRNRRIKAFYQIVQETSFRAGVRSLLQSSGLGKLKPNTLLIGFMNRWQEATVEEIDQYYHTIHDAFDLKYGVGVLRLKDGLDASNAIKDSSNKDVAETSQPDPISVANGDDKEAAHAGGSKIQMESDQYFHRKRKGFIDIWWLYDDGGLTILVPHILSLSSYWRGCKLRIFTPASDMKIKANEIHMANLLKKFRIDFSCVVEFHGINKHPSTESVNDFKKYRNGEHLIESKVDEKTLRQIRIGELLREHSHNAVLIVMTLPIPRQSIDQPLMYMSWLEVLSAKLPPVLLIRGNQESVLTYYS